MINYCLLFSRFYFHETRPYVKNYWNHEYVHAKIYLIEIIELNYVIYTNMCINKASNKNIYNANGMGDNSKQTHFVWACNIICCKYIFLYFVWPKRNQLTVK